MAQSEISPENGSPKTVWPEELERVPLKQRLKLLLASHRISVDSGSKFDTPIPIPPPIAAERREDESLFPKNPVTVKVECADDWIEGSSQEVDVEPEMRDEFIDELDHVVFKERLRRLLTSKCLVLTSTLLEDISSGTVKREVGFGGDERHVVSGNQVDEIDITLKSSTSKLTVVSSYKPHQAVGHCSPGKKSTDADSSGIQRNDRMYPSEKECFQYELDGGKTAFGDIRTLKDSNLPSLANIKTEPQNYDDVQSSNVTTLHQMSFGNFAFVKSESQPAGDAYEDDELDHMLLQERMKLFSSKVVSRLDSKCTSKMAPSLGSRASFASKPALSIKVNRPRKRRRTVTDLVETAMEEDAPGLLQVLIEKGVTPDEIKLYGEPESNDALDFSSASDNFAELEDVITKLFSQRESLIKFGAMRCPKGEKASYCLECLFSLVEQARYLRFRNWPAEWGWCRDLQSFIFVFERHNRIVLERPEYGYATYFFELVDSLPIDWQIKRLVIAMKLTSCSRITVIENKALMVGDDLTEGEAQVLMNYGWSPNTGLGTMLNYYDRVVHDRKNEKFSSEWRSKIGKLLMDGYNGGTIISNAIPGRDMEDNVTHPLEVKLELS